MKARILVVDSWNVLSSILRTHRYQPIWTADGIQTCVRPEGPASHHLVGSRSAGGDGFVVLERLKSNRLLTAIPVNVVTGQDPGVAEQKAREYGAIAVLREPVKADELIATIRGVLGQHA